MSAAPPAELTREQVLELQRDLVQQREELADQLSRSDKNSQPVELDQQLVGRLSRMDAIQQQQMAAANAAQAAAHLNRVELALAAVESGDFGYCRRCDEPIGFARLKARPDSPLCLNCQQDNES